jgi:purine-nucleoside/S-methyl-5'-thioadenosine phosphorylase / adenosine deaminase
VIRWQAPGPYVVAFTTRGEGDLRGGDNARRACEALGLDPTRLAANRQRHTPVVHRAHPGVQDEPGDGLWTDEPGVPLVAFGADCVPIALVAANGHPTVAVVHAGWRGLAEGVVGAAVQALGAVPKAAVVGPAVGPCCYEVGPEVSELFDADLTRDRILDLWTAAERALRRAGVEQVDRLDLCTRCDAERFFSHRREGARRGLQGVIAAIAE